MAQAIDLRKQEGAFDRCRQAIQQLVQLHQGLQDDRPVFLGRCHALRQFGQSLVIGALQILIAIALYPLAAALCAWVDERGQQRR